MKIRKMEIFNFKQAFSLALFLLVFLLSCVQDVYGYLDPGTGSYVLQLIIAFFVGALYTSKMIRGKILGFFKTTFSRKKHVNKSNERAGQS